VIHFDTEVLPMFLINCSWVYPYRSYKAKGDNFYMISKNSFYIIPLDL